MARFNAGRSDQGRKQSLTATSDGLTTGLIAKGAKVVVPTSANANHILTLPATRAGHEILILQDTNATGFELRAQGASIKINATEVTNSSSVATKELAVAAAKTLKCVCISATEWIVTKYATSGASGGGGTPD
jgi:hypothetical protein